MKLFRNNTSPYARIARIVLEEKGYSDIETELVDPWSDAPQLLDANSAARVPALVTDDGQRLTESLLIALWAEAERPTPSLLGADRARAVARAGVAMGVIDAAVHTLVGRKIAGPGFDESPVGLRRRRSMANGLRRLEQDPPAAADADAAPDIGVITAVVALDYVRFRFPNASWMPQLPALDRLAAAVSTRASFERSRPHD